MLICFRFSYKVAEKRNAIATSSLRKALPIELKVGEKNFFGPQLHFYFQKCSLLLVSEFKTHAKLILAERGVVGRDQNELGPNNNFFPTFDWSFISLYRQNTSKPNHLHSTLYGKRKHDPSEDLVLIDQTSLLLEVRKRL